MLHHITVPVQGTDESNARLCKIKRKTLQNQMQDFHESNAGDEMVMLHNLAKNAI